MASLKSLRRYLRLYSDELLTANELFPAILDSFSETHVSEELEGQGPEICRRLKVFLTSHRPATFTPFVIGKQLSMEEKQIWAAERQRKYKALLLALRIDTAGQSVD